jgi:hypothetical protein
LGGMGRWLVAASCIGEGAVCGGGEGEGGHEWRVGWGVATSALNLPSSQMDFFVLGG